MVSSQVESRDNLYSRINQLELGDSRVLYQGHHQIVRLGSGSLVLNIDCVRREFYAYCSLLEVVGEVFGSRRSESIQASDLRDSFRLKSALRRLVVRMTHRITNLKEIVGVSELPASSTMITINDRQVSVEEYFRDRYHIRLRFPNLPPVNLGGRRPGSECSVPMELCEVAPGQRYSGLDRSNSAFCAVSTLLFAPKTALPAFSSFVYNSTMKMFLSSAFGVTVAQSMETVGGRVLEPPTIRYANGTHRPANGTWTLSNKTFVNPAKLAYWGVVVCNRLNDDQPCVRLRAVDRFISNLCKEAASRGMHVRNRDLVVVCADRPRGTMESWLTSCHERLERLYNTLGGPQLIVVIKPDDDASEYQEIKRITHSVLGIPSQCVTADVLDVLKFKYWRTCASRSTQS